MRQLVLLFRNCLTAAASSCDITLPQLMRERGVDDFLIDIDANELSAQEIAVAALTELCEACGKVEFVIAIAVVAYLDKTIGRPQEVRLEGGRREKDLLLIIRSEVRTEASYQQWLKSWYA